MPFIESFDEFKQRQGCEFMLTHRDEFIDKWLFANGASCVLRKLGVQREFLRSEPPTDKWDLLRARRAFLTAKLSKETKDYQAALTDLQQSSYFAARFPESCPAVSPAAIDALRDGLLYIESLRVELKQFDEQLADSPEAREAKLNKERAQLTATKHAERQRTADEVAGMLASFQVPTRDIVQEVGDYLRSNG